MAELDIFGPRVGNILEKRMKAKTEAEKSKLLDNLVKEVVKKLNDVSVSNFPSDVAINNLDEVKAALRNELTRANKPLSKLIKALDLTSAQQKKLLSDIEKQSLNLMEAGFEKVFVKKVKDRVEITNLSDIIFPEKYTIENLKEIESYLKDLAQRIEKAVNLPAPQVTVEPTPVNIPETVIPEVDLDPLKKEISLGLNKIRTNSKQRPLAVRITDGNNWIKEFASKISTTLAGYSDQLRLRGVQGGVINPATEESVSVPGAITSGNKDVASAGTAEKLVANATPCKEVIITGKAANGSKIYIGGSTTASTDGTFIYASQTIRIPIDDVSKIYIDADTNSEGVQFAYLT